MGCAVSSLHTGILLNLSTDFVKQESKLIGSVQVCGEESPVTTCKNKGLDVVTNIEVKPESEKKIIYQKQKNRKCEVIKAKRHTKNKAQGSDEDPEDFFQDFFSSVNANLCNDDQSFKEILPKENVEDPTEEEECALGPYLPIINLQGRPNPAWFRKSLTNTSTVQRIYQPRDKVTPIRR